MDGGPARLHAVRSQHPVRRPVQQPAALRVVDQRGDAQLHRRRAAPAEGPAEVLPDPGDGLQVPPPHLVVQGAQGPPEGDGIWNDIGGGTAVDLSKGEHHRVGGVVVPADQGLELHQQSGAEDHRVHAQLRVGAVAPLPRHLQADAVAAGVGDPLPDGDGPQGQVGGAVEAHHRVGRPIPEQALAQHSGRTVKGLLPALEDQQHVSPQLLPVPGQQLGAAQQGGGMDVVAAGVAHPRRLGGERQPGILLDGQGVDVLPQGQQTLR